MKKKDKKVLDLYQENKVEIKKFKYMCHGCGNEAGRFMTAEMNLRIVCPICGMDQLSELQNFIYEQ